MDKSSPKMWSISEILNLPKVDNHPLGENSPNVVIWLGV
jgi:hypothetical protein